MAVTERILDEIALELYNWNGLPEWMELFLRVLASLPGGERAEELGFAPLTIGWREVALLGRWLSAVESAEDVQYIIAELFPEEVET